MAPISLWLSPWRTGVYFLLILYLVWPYDCMSPRWWQKWHPTSSRLSPSEDWQAVFAFSLWDRSLQHSVSLNLAATLWKAQATCGAMWGAVVNMPAEFQPSASINGSRVSEPSWISQLKRTTHSLWPQVASPDWNYPGDPNQHTEP